MKKLYLPLFWKFSIAIILIVIVFGSVNIFMIYNDLDQKLYNKSLNRINIISNTFFNQAKFFVINNNFVSLQSFVDSYKKSDTSISYVIVYIDDIKRIFSSVDDNKALISKKDIFENNSDIYYSEYEDDKSNGIIDVSKKININPKIYARIGFYEVSHTYKKGELIVPFIFMVIAFLIIGIAGAFVFARFITKPIKEIIQIADNLEFDSFESKKGLLEKLKVKLFGRFFPGFTVRDELDILVNKFYKMVKRVDTAYKEKEHSYSKLIQAEKLASIGTLTAGIAHEINNPIAGIKNCVRRISEDPENYDQNKEYLELMSSAIKRTEEVVKRLLDYSRTPEMVFKRVDINEVIEKSVMLLSYKLEKFHISIHNKISHKIPQIYGNFNQLEQVFVNMLMNSIDAIESRSFIDRDFPYLIEFNGFVRENRVLIEVSDHGIGIEQDKLEAVFDPFYTSKEIGKGTGLGLFVSYQIIQSHNGTIKVDNKYTDGAKFIIEFPLP